MDSLRKKPGLAVFKAWLSAAIDEPQRLEHLNKVVELLKLQHNSNRGFIVISDRDSALNNLEWVCAQMVSLYMVTLTLSC